jgi:hypothetical protein
MLCGSGVDRWLAPSLLALSFVPAMASAQSGPTPIKADASKAWEHKASSIIIPSTLGGIPRTSVVDFDRGEWDVAGEYELSGLSTVVTLYVYQAAIQDASIWFGEAQRPLEARKSQYGTVKALAPVAAFAPPGDLIASGLRVTYGADGPYRSTALAVAPLGDEWIVKLRLSSREKSPEQLDAMLSAVINEIAWPAKAVRHTLAQPMKDCSVSLPDLPKSKPLKDSGTSAMFGGLFSLPGLMTPDEKSPPAPPYCRDTKFAGDLSVYHVEGATDRYLISLGDSGRAIFSEPDLLAALIATDAKKRKTSGASYTVRMVVPGTTTVFGAQDRLPPPEQAIEIVSAGHWASQTGRGKGNQTININSDTFKH